ncbi:hypothetical protein ABZ319_34450 [Nocardia sp. NPDC005978]|uniref:hypothetical protein n=1 Tax=Nocardia sp. NPDC005978 TaxID=3156725 RepID=UPI0033BB7A25
MFDDLPLINHDPVPWETMTDARAHRVMQQHGSCPISVCGAKSQAHCMLVAAGRVTPAGSAARPVTAVTAAGWRA